MARFSVTAHVASDGDDTGLDWPALAKAARSGLTLIIYMGVTQLHSVIEALVAGGPMRSRHDYRSLTERTGSMIFVPPALSFLLVIVAGWVHRQQLIVIDRKAKAVGRKARSALFQAGIRCPQRARSWHTRQGHPSDACR